MAVDRSIPAPLEAICLKAMAKAPEARYGSVRATGARPGALAGRRAGRRLTRRRRVERLSRWFRQHRAWTYAGGGRAGWSGPGRERCGGGHRGGAGVGKTTARLEAETNFDMAQKAVEDYLTNVSENTLLKEQDSLDMRTLRSDLLKSALVYYEQFAAQRKNDPRLRKQLAKAHFRVGQITSEIGSKTQAMGAFRSALAILVPLVEANPKEHELAGSLGETYLAMGRLESLDHSFSAALEQLNRSSAILERVARANPSEPRYLAMLADCYSETGISLASLKRPDESLSIHEKARAIQEGLIHRYPGNLAYHKGLAENLNAIGFAQYTRNDKDKALKTFHDVKDICQTLLAGVSEGPKPTWLLNLLALSEQNIGNIHKEKKELEKALKYFEEALNYRSDLVDLHPSVTRFRVKLGVSYREIAELEHERPPEFQGHRIGPACHRDLYRPGAFSPGDGGFSLRSWLVLERSRRSS